MFCSKSASFQLLKISGADVNTKDKYGATPVMAAIHFGNWDMAEHLVTNHQVSLVDMNIWNGWNIIHYLAVDYSDKSAFMLEETLKQSPGLIHQW